jgi:hypothetical protein
VNIIIYKSVEHFNSLSIQIVNCNASYTCQFVPSWISHSRKRRNSIMRSRAYVFWIKSHGNNESWQISHLDKCSDAIFFVSYTLNHNRAIQLYWKSYVALIIVHTMGTSNINNKQTYDVNLDNRHKPLLPRMLYHQQASLCDVTVVLRKSAKLFEHIWWATWLQGPVTWCGFRWTL